MPGVTDMWKVALQDGYCITLFRDEVIMFHKEFQNLLDGMKGYCLISNREGLVTSLYIMGLTTIDAHSQKEHTEIHKIPTFGGNQASFELQGFKNVRINKEMYGHPDAVFGQRPDCHTFLCF